MSRSDDASRPQSFQNNHLQEKQIANQETHKQRLVLSREEITVRTWIRSQGELLSSEFGAGAAVVASVLNGFTDRDVQVHLSGGNLLIQWSEEDNRLYCSGPADYVFTGTYYYEEGEI